MTVPAFTCTLDPAAAIEGRTELPLNAGAIAIPSPTQIDWGEAAIKAFLAEQLFGEVPSDFRVPNRIVSIPLVLGAKASGTEAEEEEVRRKLEQKVGLLQREGGVLLRQRAAGEPLYADIVNATLTVPDVYGEVGGIELGVLLKLECLPDFYGEEIALDAIEEVKGDFEALLKKAGVTAVIQGDYPGRTRLVVTEEGFANRRSMFWGFRSTGYSAAATNALGYNANLMTPLNGAVEKGNSGTYNGKVIALTEPFANSWHPFLQTTLVSGAAPLTQLGSYRVWVRIRAFGEGQKVRFEWGSHGASATTLNEEQEVPFDAAASEEEGFFMVDLGEVRLEEPPIGTHTWVGTLGVNTGSEVHEIEVDKLWLQPLDEGSGLLRATAVPTASSVSQAKSPTEASNTGSGTEWINPSGALVAGEAHVTLAHGTSSKILKLLKPELTVPEGVTIRGIEVSIPNMQLGSGYFGTARLYKAGVLAGATRPLANGINTVGGATDLWGTTWTAAQVNAANFGVGLVAIDESAFPIPPRLRGPVLITVYFTFASGELPKDAVLYINRECQVTTDGAYREDKTTEAHARISEETGSLIRIPPSGVEGRPCQLLIKMSEGLLPGPVPPPAEPDESAFADKIAVQVFYRPCYLGRI